MNTLHPRLGFLLLTLLARSAFGAVHYVDVNSTNATPPFLDWSTAATNIQDAVDIAVADDEIVVTNGIYATGGRAIYGTMTNRVAVDKPLKVRSVNGPQFTLILGAEAPGGGNGDGAIRCVQLADGAFLSGFTLTNGATRRVHYFVEDSGGGLWCGSVSPVVSNCVFVANRAQDVGGGACGGTLVNCTLAGNTASQGGGAYGAYPNFCTLNNCILAGNSSDVGGGVYFCALTNCTLIMNAANYGGGAYRSELDHCTLAGNLGFEGGGAYGGNLTHCLLTGNAAWRDGGGFYSDYTSGSFLNHCLLTGNSATNSGGGVFGDWSDNPTLNNCTITGNSTSYSEGGVHGANLTNCIIYFNNSPIGPNWSQSRMDYCCTTPLPYLWLPTNQPPSTGHNITNAPSFVDLLGGNLRLQSNSPCINSGRNASAPAGPDLDGNPRIANGTVDIGAYEFQGSGSLISYAWLQQYGWATDGSADFADPDGDGRNNWQEWRCQTDPTNSLSVLRLLSATPNGSNVTVSWQSVAGVNYFLERSTNLGSPNFQSSATNLLGQAGITTFTHTSAAGAPANFYRVGVP